uniref:G_PROTEIN_RECEP_F1_2 domain-containing protein n=1 Tax=Steinernema glaseri TaxID=37863 RepID=A0A1I7YFY4_9BILA
MMAIAIDRFLCLQFPVIYRSLETHRFCLVRFLICLSYSLIGSFMPYLDYPVDEYSETCNYKKRSRDQSPAQPDLF